jgi:hypothetical protein
MPTILPTPKSFSKSRRLIKEASLKQNNNNDPLQDGLWQVDVGGICGGFVVKDGNVVQCAPILRWSFAYWRQFAKRHNSDVGKGLALPPD